MVTRTSVWARKPSPLACAGRGHAEDSVDEDVLYGSLSIIAASSRTACTHVAHHPTNTFPPPHVIILFSNANGSHPLLNINSIVITPLPSQREHARKRRAQRQRAVRTVAIPYFSMEGGRGVSAAEKEFHAIRDRILIGVCAMDKKVPLVAVAVTARRCVHSIGLALSRTLWRCSA